MPLNINIDVMYFGIMAGSSRNATERASLALSSSSQIVSLTQTTSSNQTANFTSSSSLRLISEFCKPDFIVFVDYEDDPHENNREEEESDEEKEDKESK